MKLLLAASILMAGVAALAFIPRTQLRAAPRKAGARQRRQRGQN